MNGILNENQLTILKKYDFDNPKIDEIDYLLDTVIKDCRHKVFHLFEYILVYDIKFTNTLNNEGVNSKNTHRDIEFKNERCAIN